jgi:AcrR family transcriptional regulator
MFIEWLRLHEPPSASAGRAHARRYCGAAGRVFAEHGFHQATLEAVAAEAGVSKGALYHYFPSKEQLFLAVLEDRLGAGLDDIDAVVAERGTDSRHLEGGNRATGVSPRGSPGRDR